jgi:hypothetical protein
MFECVMELSIGLIFKRLTKTRKGDKMETPSWTLDFSKVHVSIIKLISKIMSALSQFFFGMVLMTKWY